MDWIRGGNAGARHQAASLLRQGKLVAVPTETVYGLAADAANEEAVRSIFAVKGRPLLDPLIVHFASLEQIAQVCEVTPETERIAQEFWPGPLTLVLPRRSDCRIPDLVSAGKPTLAVRIPSHPLFRQLLQESQLPLAAPSANPFGYISPTRPEHVEASLPQGVAAVLDGGPCEHGVESTIIAVEPSGGIRLLRPGPLSLNEILKLPGIHEATDDRPADIEKAPSAPGMLKSHYRPTKGVELFRTGTPPSVPSGNEAIVFLQRPQSPQTHHFWFSESGNEKEIARNLFDLLRKLDTLETFERVHVEMPNSNDGILRAVRDRLSRAATPPD